MNPYRHILCFPWANPTFSYPEPYVSAKENIRFRTRKHTQFQSTSPSFSKCFEIKVQEKTDYFFRLFFTTAGTPAARESSGISRVTTLPAAMMQRLPMVTPGQTTTLPPSQQSSPTVMG